METRPNSILINVNLKQIILPTVFQVSKKYLRQQVRDLFEKSKVMFQDKGKKIPRMSLIIESPDTLLIKDFQKSQFIEKTYVEKSIEGKDIEVTLIFNFFDSPNSNTEVSSRIFEDGFFQKHFHCISYKVGQSVDASINRGNFGTVKMCLSKKDGQYYAIKILTPKEFKPEQRFELQREFREIQALIRLNHQNIVRFYNYWFQRVPENTQQYVMFIQMQLVGNYFEGQNTLNYYSASVIELMPIVQKRREILRIFKEIRDGLQYMHQKGFVHRDLKPPNILVDFDGSIKIADFGFAKDIEVELENLNLTLKKEPSMTCGSDYYKPPEVGYQNDFGSDLYALGEILFDLIYGMTNEKYHEIIKNSLHENITYKQELQDQFPQKCLQDYPIETQIIAIMMDQSSQNRDAIDSHLEKWENILQLQTQSQ